MGRKRRKNWTQIVWDGTPSGNVEHVEAHDLKTDEVDHVLERNGDR
jgi:hypothetical protein